MSTHTTTASSSQPWLHQNGEVIQEFGTVKQSPIGLSLPGPAPASPTGCRTGGRRVGH